MSTSQHLLALREQIVASFGEAGERLVALPLTRLEALTQTAAPDPVELEALLDQLEDLLEAMLHESGWVEAGGGSS